MRLLVTSIILFIINCSTLTAQHCTRFAERVHTRFLNGIKLSDDECKYLDTALIEAFVLHPEAQINRSTFKQSATNKLAQHLNSEIFEDVIRDIDIHCESLRQFYTIESNNLSAIENYLRDYFIDALDLENMSDHGIGTVTIHYNEYVNKIAIKVADGFHPVSPIALKDDLFEMFNTKLDSTDLQILMQGWENEIEDFIRNERSRDSTYNSSFIIIQQRIDSLEACCFHELQDNLAEFIAILPVDSLEYLRKLSRAYIKVMDESESRILEGLIEYNAEYAPHIYQFYEYMYKLKDRYPSYKYYLVAGGKPFKVASRSVVTASTFYKLYENFERSLVKILDDNMVRFGFPNYYYMTKSHQVEDIRIRNILLFAMINSDTE